MEINKKLVKYNFNKGRSGQKIKYIVWHDTGNDKPLATAMAHFNYFNGGKVSASAHYFVDEKEILQIIEDSDTAWHVGDGKGKYGITNSNSIGIEICINDGNYDTEIKRGIELTRHLMNKYNIPLENVVRHYDASRKLCPAKMSKNDWELWKSVKNRLKDEVVVVDKTKPSSWAKDTWELAIKDGITDGTRPKDVATREEIVMMIYRALNKGGK